MADHIQSDPYEISAVEIYVYILIKTKIWSVRDYVPIHDRHSVPTHRICLFNVWVFMERPTDQVHLDVGCIPLKNIVKGKKRLLLSILHCYSKTFQYKCTSDTRGVPPRWIVIYYPKGKPQRAERVSGDRAPGLPALWEGEGPDHTSRAQGKEDSPPPLIHFAGNMVASTQPLTNSEPDHVKQSLDICLRVCPGKEEGSRRWCVCLFSSVPSCSVYLCHSVHLPRPCAGPLDP